MVMMMMMMMMKADTHSDDDDDDDEGRQTLYQYGDAGSCTQSQRFCTRFQTVSMSNITQRCSHARNAIRSPQPPKNRVVSQPFKMFSPELECGQARLVCCMYMWNCAMCSCGGIRDLLLGESHALIRT